MSENDNLQEADGKNEVEITNTDSTPTTELKEVEETSNQVNEETTKTVWNLFESQSFLNFNFGLRLLKGITELCHQRCDSADTGDFSFWSSIGRLKSWKYQNKIRR